MVYMQNIEIKKVASKTLITEEKTDGHSPMKFLCSDDQIYYCKYRVDMNQEEIDFLLYEIVCHFLLKYLKVPTPEIALVTLTKDSFDPKHLVRNKRYSKPGVICFGSKLVDSSSLLIDMQIIDSRSAFKRLDNPMDLIKIALFDLWVDNVDRGRQGNFNILMSASHRKTTYYAFDNAFAFGGQKGLRIFKPAFPIARGIS